MQRPERALSPLAVGGVGPGRDEVVYWAARHAERNAAVHAARPLHAGGLVGEPRVELAVMLLPRFFRLVRLLQPLELQESGDLAHQAAALFCAASSPSARRYS